MPRIDPISQEAATGDAAKIMADVKKKMGRVPNLISTMAHSPAVANAYLSFSGALSDGILPSHLRERIALTIGQGNECTYCISAHTMLGKNAGLNEEEIVAARRGTASDEKVAAAVAFARKLAEKKGNVSDEDLATVRNAGYSDGEIGEIVAHVALNIFTNYFNHVADPEIDFPVAPGLVSR